MSNFEDGGINPYRKSSKDGGSREIELLLVAIGGFVGYGAVKLVKGIGNSIKARKLNKDAKNNLATAKDSFEVFQKASNTALESLGRKKWFVLDKSISRFVASFEKLKNVQLEDSTGMDELNKFRVDEQSTAELKELRNDASSILGGAAAGALSGTFAAFGAFSAATAFGVASTGTAIATLNGAAAINAALAFMGGGALAAGGLGMAGGLAVLSAVFAVPALTIMGVIFVAKASKKARAVPIIPTKRAWAITDLAI
jgi:hypothetical protein